MICFLDFLKQNKKNFLMCEITIKPSFASSVCKVLAWWRSMQKLATSQKLTLSVIFANDTWKSPNQLELVHSLHEILGTRYHFASSIRFRKCCCRYVCTTRKGFRKKKFQITHFVESGTLGLASIVLVPIFPRDYRPNVLNQNDDGTTFGCQNRV